MPHSSGLESPSFEEIQAFLAKIGQNNESTEYTSDQEYIVKGITELAKIKGWTAIVEEFETPYLHPMITVQKWIDELKHLANEALKENESGNVHTF